MPERQAISPDLIKAFASSSAKQLPKRSESQFIAIRRAYLNAIISEKVQEVIAWIVERWPTWALPRMGDG